MNLSKLLTLTFILAGCSPLEYPVSRNEVFGEYVAVYHDATHKLVLFDNGTYEHSYIIDGKLLVDRHNWEFLDVDIGESDLYLRLFEFKFRVAKDTISKSKDWILSPEKTKRFNFSENKNHGLRVRLCFNYDLDRCYVKK